MQELRDRLKKLAEPQWCDECLRTHGNGTSDLEQMASALLGVMELHKPHDACCCCTHDEKRWPCPTVRLIAERMSGGK